MLPNILTFSRILMIPLVVCAFFIDTATWRAIGAIGFIGACITDYLDGYFARLWSQTSKLGQFLDPVADKLLVATTLLLLAGFNKMSQWSLIPALIILGREILVSSLREYLSEIHVPLPVSRLAKWKTFIQMISLTTLLLAQQPPAFEGSILGIIGEILLWIAAALTMITAYLYFNKTVRYL